MLNNNLINWQNNLYFLKFHCRSNIDSEYIEYLKFRYMADTVLRKDDRLFFCALIPDAEIINDEENKDEVQSTN